MSRSHLAPDASSHVTNVYFGNFRDIPSDCNLDESAFRHPICRAAPKARRLDFSFFLPWCRKIPTDEIVENIGRNLTFPLSNPFVCLNPFTNDKFFTLLNGDGMQTTISNLMNTAESFSF